MFVLVVTFGQTLLLTASQKPRQMYIGTWYFPCCC